MIYETKHIHPLKIIKQTKQASGDRQKDRKTERPRVPLHIARNQKHEEAEKPEKALEKS